MERTNAIKNIKVGIATLLSVAIAIAAYSFVGSLTFGSRTYEIQALFKDVQGIQDGAPVMMAGVKVGTVRDITLTPSNKARVSISIKEERKIPVGSVARISSITVLGDKFLEIIPGPAGGRAISAGATLPGLTHYNVDDLLPQISGVLQRMDSIGESLHGFISDQELRDRLKSTVINMDLASAAAVALVSDLRGVTAENRSKVSQATGNLVSATSRMASTADRLDDALQGVSREDLESIFSDVRSAAKQFDEAAANIASITGDEQMNADIREAVRNVRETSETARQVVEKVGALTGVSSDRPASKRASKKPPSGTGTHIDLLYKADAGKVRLDANTTFQIGGGDRFYRAGLYDLGENTRVNLQVGKALSESEAIRLGLYQSRIGLGYDWQTPGGVFLQTDLYRPNEPRLDLKARFGITEDLFGWTGVEGVGGDTEPVLGVQYKF